MIWQERDCRPDAVKTGSNNVRGYVEGDFRAKTFGAQLAHRSSEHTSSALIEGKATGYKGTCRWTPSDIEEFSVTFFVLVPGSLLPSAQTLGVSLNCDVRGA